MAAHGSLDRGMLRQVLYSMLRALVWNKSDWAAAKGLTDDPARPVQRLVPGATAQELAEVGQRFAGMFCGADTPVRLDPQRSCEAWIDRVAAAGALEAEHVTFYTSGSTGAPAPCPQSLAVLWQEVGELARLATDRRRVVSVVPQHHIYGFLFSVLLPRALDVAVEVLPPLPGAGLYDALQAGDLLIAFPAFWQGLSRLGHRFPAGVRGVTSTGPCPAALIETLRQQGLEAMLEVYGSSETSGVGYRWEPQAPYTLFRFWEPVALEQAAPDALVRHGLAGPPCPPVMLPDEVAWADARTFRPLRRRDQAVQVAGINVYPRYVASRIAEHPEVAACSVRLMRPEEGARLKAFVVPVDSGRGQTALRGALQQWCRQHLRTAEQPRTFTFGERLPTKAMGKPADW